MWDDDSGGCVADVDSTARDLIEQDGDDIDSLLEEIPSLLPYFRPKTSPLTLWENVQQFLQGDTYTYGSWQVASGILHAENTSRSSTQFVNAALAPWFNDDYTLNTARIYREYLRAVNEDANPDVLPLANIRSTCTDAIFITYHEGLSIVVTGRPTDVPVRAGSGSRRGETTIHIASRDSDLDQPEVDALTEAILALFTLASTRSSSAFANQVWLRKHTVVHKNQFPNNIRAAVTFAVAVANRTRLSTVATEKATAICAKRLHSIVKRRAGERAMDLPIRTLLVNPSSMHDISSFDSERAEPDVQDHLHPATSDVATNKQQKTVYRIRLHGDGPPSLILVLRKSNTRPPKDWYYGQTDLVAGLTQFGKDVLQDYQETFSDYRGAVLIAGYGVRTCDIFATNTESHNNFERERLRYARRFSDALEHELHNSNFNVKFVSIGLDAWGCDGDHIQAFIEANSIHTFTFTFRTTSLEHEEDMSLDPALLQPGKSGTWWGEATSTDLLSRLSRKTVLEDSTDQIVRGWNSIQGRKDTIKILALRTGRNKKRKALE